MNNVNLEMNSHLFLSNASKMNLYNQVIELINIRLGRMNPQLLNNLKLNEVQSEIEQWVMYRNIDGDKRSIIKYVRDILAQINDRQYDK